MRTFYLFNSRLLTHLTFWVLYYVSFSLIWAKSGDFFTSFYLEFVLLPMRMMAVYVTLYVLIPKYLRLERYFSFGASLLLLLSCSALMQRVFIYYFYENFILNQPNELFDISQLVRSMILINSTVLFVSTTKIIQLWQEERKKNTLLSNNAIDKAKVIKIRSDKRYFRILSDDILFIEGLGNYVIYHTADQKLISYISLKVALEQLPENFVRIHKSYVVNKSQIKSYDPESVEINKVFIPVGKSFKGDLAI